MATSKAGSGGKKKIGRSKDKCARYASAKTREHNKAKRILQSNGAVACEAYCKAQGIKLPKAFSNRVIVSD